MMPDASYFREKAQRCRDLLTVAISPEVREQLLWAAEFEIQAEALEEQQQAARGAPQSSRP